jgi:hypothetical protein
MAKPVQLLVLAVLGLVVLRAVAPTLVALIRAVVPLVLVVGIVVAMFQLVRYFTRP